MSTTPLTVNLEDQSERQQFEYLAHQRYLTQRAKGKLNADSEIELTQSQLMWRQLDGTYGVLNMNAAWWGWQARAVVDRIGQLNAAGE